MEYINSLFEFIFPTEDLCFLCNSDEERVENNMCKSCRDNIDIVNIEVDLRSIYISKCYYTTIYDRFMKDIIKGFKFNDKSYMYKPLASILLETIYETDLDKEIDLIAFVPSHRRKEAIRGYNQVELLALSISKHLNIPITKTLIKKNHTQDQHFLDKSEREENLKNAFKIKNKNEIKGKNILLIDDIITSGETIRECAKILIKNEAKAIFALALTSSRKL